MGMARRSERRALVGWAHHARALIRRAFLVRSAVASLDVCAQRFLFLLANRRDLNIELPLECCALLKQACVHDPHLATEILALSLAPSETLLVLHQHNYFLHEASFLE